MLLLQWKKCTVHFASCSKKEQKLQPICSPWPQELKFCFWNRTSILHQLNFKASAETLTFYSPYLFCIHYLLFAFVSSLSALNTEMQPTLLKRLLHGPPCLCYASNDAEWHPPQLPFGWTTNIWTEPCEKPDVTH